MKKAIILCVLLVLLTANSYSYICFGCCHNPCECGLESDSFTTRIKYVNGTAQLEKKTVPCEEAWREHITVWDRVLWWYWE